MEGRPPIQSGHVTFLWEWTTEPRPEDWATSNADNLGRHLWTWGRSNSEATWWKSKRSQELRSLADGEKPRVVRQKPLEWISLLLLFFKLTYKVVGIIIAFLYVCVLYTLLYLCLSCSVFPTHWFTSLKVTSSAFMTHASYSSSLPWHHALGLNHTWAHLITCNRAC